MFRILCSLINVLLTLLTWAQEPPRRGTYGDKAYMRQFKVTQDLVEILADGRKAGLSSFFERTTYADSLQPTLDSLAATWGKGERKRIIVQGEIDGPDNRMRATVLTADDKVLGQVVVYYAPKDAICLIRKFGVVSKKKIVFDTSDLPPKEEPPPTQQMLEEQQNR